ncbi:MAG TPA: DUF445 domain-containing protein [Gemmatimonadaceae bacterium]
MLQPLDDPAKKAQLVRMKRRATGLLVLATALFVVTSILLRQYPAFWLDALRATAEAAMVGGLADWFAVTALFRHPLGLPIPHTAIIAARKDQIGRSLGNFVQRHFLSREVLSQKLVTLHAAEHLARWLTQPENSRAVARHAAAALASGVRALRDEDVQELIDGVLLRKVREIRVAPLLGQLLAVITEGDRHQELLNEAVKLLARAVDENQDTIRERIGEEAPWWIPDVVEDKIHVKIVSGLDHTLQDIRDNPQHPLRGRFDVALRTFIDKLHNSPEVQARAEAIKLELLDAEAVRRFSASMWDEAKEALFRYADNPDAFSPTAIERGLTTLGDAMLNDQKLLDRVDHYIAEIALHLVERYQSEVGQLIAQTVSSWDPDVTSQRIELSIGKDLQFIRINGTLVGGLVGLAIFLISTLF